MFGQILSRLLAPASDQLPDNDARLALAALLVRIARSDGEYSHGEAVRIDQILSERYDLEHDAALELRRDAELLEESAPDTVRFTRAIKEAVAYEDRLKVVEAAWRVVMADGARADEEDALMRLIASLLGVSDLDSNIARQKAAQE